MELTHAQIAEYLIAHPDFFNQHGALLAELSLPHPHGTHAISITERQVLSLREKNQMLERKLAELISFGEENDAISTKLHRLALALMAATTPQELVSQLTLALHDDFAVPHVAMRLWGITADMAECAPAPEGLMTTAGHQPQPVCGPLRHQESAAWFGESFTHLRSFASIPLKAGQSPGHGLLVLGAEDPRRFYPEMGTLYLARLGQLAGAALARMAN
jgi:uncharacterized protein YigA (DUF484 family)